MVVTNRSGGPNIIPTLSLRRSFSYEDGVWKGANPPHIQPQDSSSESGRQNKLRHAKSEGDIPSWFAEVLELRNRAQEYQKRARGTHFSRERLVQLLTGAKATGESSTAVSSSSLTTSLSDIHEGAQQITKTINEKVPESNEQQSEERSRKEPSPVRRKLAWGENEKKEEVSRDRSSSYGSIPTPDGYRGSVSDTSEDASVLSEEGRLPTPRLETGGQRQRHHLDKTTPASGGAILTSPPRRKDVRPRPRTAPSGAVSSHRTNAALRPQTRPSAEVVNGSGVSTSLGLERNGIKNRQ
ncbi:putative nuclear protein MDM1-like isoform X6, partial [Apostichopus japonicus]